MSLARMIAELRYLGAVLKGSMLDLGNPNRVKVKKGRGQRRNRRNRR